MEPIKVTQAAWKQIAKLSDGRFGIKIGLKKGGCAGMEYDMQVVDRADQHDLTVSQGETHIVIDAKAQMFLFGTEIDYQTNILESGFTFNNPNVAEECGCGESVSFEVNSDFQVPKLS